ncbi:putative Myo-inositol transporter 1 [Pyronema domesticum]|uniref:Similar to Sugar transporter STL1 acc. no. P39932 n=1 Tax=Pyronema omphalodes (strain CBS 100304) TaxID=1076935 RepID=U4LVW6_PYROM|nr:putative Myo-inositol transporter 1 [Pyronema domesticum]CCX32891.1 Similar to Sugar transporter STL1; acc. no. P39932 [Pyronema omphalodes CBS 100304]
MSSISEKQYFFGARGTKLVASVVLASSSAFLLLGYDQGVLGGLLANHHLQDVLGHPSPSMTGTIVAIYDIGCLVGALITAAWAENYGRRKSAMCGLSIMLIGAALQTSSFSREQMIVSRTITGVGNGINAATIPMWVSEIVKPHNRGRLNSFSGSMIGFGIFFSYWFDYGLSYVKGDISWRLPIALQMLFAMVTLTMIFFLPESPRWLVAHDNVEEAAHVLACLESTTATPSTPSVVAALTDIQTAIAAEHAAGPVQWKELWTEGELKNRTRVLLACGINFFQQMSGCNALVYYIPFLLQHSVGLDANTSLLVSGLNGLVFFLFSIYPLLFLDKWGRPKPFIVASLVQSFSMVMVAILLSIGTTATNKASVVFFFTYIAIFGTCYLGTPWSYGPELLPLRLRARGSAIATAVNWTCNFIIVEITPPAITNIGWKTYIIFGVLNFCWAPLLYLYYPDTARKSLEEIDNLFRDEKIDFEAVEKAAIGGDEKKVEEGSSEHLP